MRNAFRSMIAAAVVAVAFFGSANRSEAAIRLTITQGASTVYYYNSTNFLSTGQITVGTWTLFVDNVLTNFTGQATGGQLQQSIQVTGPVTGIMTAYAEVIDSVMGLANGQVTLAADVTALTGAALGQFTLPSSPLGYQVTQDAGTSSSTTSAGTAQGFGTVNGQTTASLLNSLSANIESLQMGTAPGAATYTMQQLVTINATSSSTNFSVNATTGVMAIPEPASVLSALFGVPALGYWVRRRKVAQELAA